MSKNDQIPAIKRYIGLDITRIFAMLSVCAFHTQIHLNCDYGFFQQYTQYHGTTIMSLFFMLSGSVAYLSNVKKELNGIEIKSYYIKKAISIYPLYWICALLYILLRGGGTWIQDITLFPIETLGVQSFFTDSLFSYAHNGGTWFVSCLVFCYLLYPLFHIIIQKTGNKTKVIVFIILAFIIMYYGNVAKVMKVSSSYTNPIIRSMEFCIGSVIASGCCSYKQIRMDNDSISDHKQTLRNVLFYLSLCLTVFVYNNIIRSWYPTVVIFGIVIVLALGVEIKLKWIKKTIEQISNMAYSFFLAQLFSNWWGKQLISKWAIDNNVHKILMGWIICIVIAIALHYTIEKPSQILLYRLMRHERNKWI